LARNGQGGNIPAACREHNVTEQTFYRWRRKFGGMEVSEAKKLRALERENTELKKRVADWQAQRFDTSRWVRDFA
jgi:putative transposase